MKLNLTGLLLACLAVAGAAWLVGGPSAPPYEDQLIGVAVRQSFGDAASQVEMEPLEVQALLLDYADNEQLVLKARLALLRYPDLARRILPIYGGETEFQVVLLTYGEATLPPIAYFMDHELTSLEIRHALSDRVERARLLYARLMGTPVDAAPPATESAAELTAEDRGWYAVHFILEEGYDFLGQFAVDPDGNADWVQTERVTEGVANLFLGGIRGLEAKWRQGGAGGQSSCAWHRRGALRRVLRAGGPVRLPGAGTRWAARPRRCPLWSHPRGRLSHVPLPATDQFNPGGAGGLAGCGSLVGAVPVLVCHPLGHHASGPVPAGSAVPGVAKPGLDDRCPRGQLPVEARAPSVRTAPCLGHSRGFHVARPAPWVVDVCQTVCRQEKHVNRPGTALLRPR